MGSESRTCDTGIRVESHPKTVAMGYQDWRLLTGTELTNQGGCLIATIPAKDRVKMSEDLLDVCPVQISRMHFLWMLQGEKTKTEGWTCLHERGNTINMCFLFFMCLLSTGSLKRTPLWVLGSLVIKAHLNFLNVKTFLFFSFSGNCPQCEKSSLTISWGQHYLLGIWKNSTFR